MSEEKSRPPQDRPWESGWAPDTSRAPGTRRLWLAGALAVATVTACVTAITVMDSRSGEPAPSAAQPSTLSSSAPGGLISFATPSEKGTDRPGKEHGRPSPTPTASTSPSPDAKPEPAEKKKPTSPAPDRTSKPPKPPAPHGTSIRSVNYPDRYWQISGGYVTLAAPGSASDRSDATFERVAGLADSSCYSFATADGGYLRHRSFVLRAERNDGSSLFGKDATFCPRPASPSGAVMLESVNYPGRFLRHRNFQLRLEPYQYDGLYRADSAFRLVAGLD
ncbi:AbfB domain-containing protein [Streptomyces venetus]|uniref:AbfB domain-containing protein n=1 Tax=Streptomyces venetus TaxID=1701086 RepID=UPI003C2AED29